MVDEDVDMTQGIIGLQHRISAETLAKVLGVMSDRPRRSWGKRGPFPIGTLIDLWKVINVYYTLFRDDHSSCPEPHKGSARQGSIASHVAFVRGLQGRRGGGPGAQASDLEREVPWHLGRPLALPQRDRGGGPAADQGRENRTNVRLLPPGGGGREEWISHGWGNSDGPSVTRRRHGTSG